MSGSFDYAAAAAAGHNLTYVNGPIAGYTTYYCENCGAVVMLHQADLKFWHFPKGSSSTADACKPAGDSAGDASNTLKAKLQKERQGSFFPFDGVYDDENSDDAS